ncbi:threonylcarbamoyl-AMP synthase [Siccirubricoccus sp. KC 17139]|uniref:Threonylcarbamoyl-AMP synthase n=1 Tax=Siccirubricoccus soli TaxID=2899147 RepID=A0ABT1D9J4_9PROT|nr:L-threonylcarbamoyladenylate synthase [Siccirubricoccus soli]MCO6418597.1 threonylcarbamoyl-AMP synthase [Siccirubricoccus soli]MCP2684732.1 L-threonylcarbamoyladenylate synthase [Siccirubricoccus soli]
MTRLLPPEAVAEAAALLRAGELVAFPTETVYGLGGDARNGRAVAAIFAAKGRPHFNPLISHYPSAEAAFADVQPDDRARALAAAFWPGPLTLVLPRRPGAAIDLLAGAGLDTLAVRVPAHPLALALLRAAALPVAGPSANLSGQVSPTTPAHVLAGLGGRIAAVLDGGPCAVGVESTVLDLTGAGPRGGAVLLRPGGITVEAIEALIGKVGRPGPQAAAAAARSLRSPGMLLSHYAPSLPVRLNATKAAADEALLAFGPALPGATVTWNLSETGDLAEAAARLFAGLRWLDAEGSARGCARIAAMAVPERGLGIAINDRLARAAAPRG